jgi:hypothetical protein
MLEEQEPLSNIVRFLRRPDRVARFHRAIRLGRFYARRFRAEPQVDLSQDKTRRFTNQQALS